jgi:hypothetical protein
MSEFGQWPVPTAFPLAELIACAERETEMRRRVYPKRVGDKRMSQRFADLEIARMEAIAERLRELAGGER